MSEPTCPAVIDTLGKLIDHGMGAFMACPTCLKAGRPDVRDIDLDPERVSPLDKLGNLQAAGLHRRRSQNAKGAA
jgi:hypothetical protein